MLDILMPVQASDSEIAPGAIDSLIKFTDVPVRFIVIVDGGVRDDIFVLERFLSSLESPWKLLHNEQPVYLNQTLREGLDECETKIVAMVAPHVRVDDDKWFGKVQQIFSRDPICGIVDMWPNTKSSTLHPIKRAHNIPAPEGCRFAVLQTAFAKKALPFGSVDPVHHWSRSVLSGGGSSWAAPGVRYFEVEHKEHELWRAPLAPTNRSE